MGGPGAIFWMWIVAILGMSIKLIEVTLAMIYRNVDDPEKPYGGPMWVAERAFEEYYPSYAGVGKVLAIIFSISVITSAITGGNMFQAWSVADITYEYFGIEGWKSGLILSLIVGSVIVGGIGSPVGAIAGAFLVSFSEVLLTYAYKKFLMYLLPLSMHPNSLVQLIGTEYKYAISFVILVIVLLIKPTGLFKGKVIVDE